MSERDIGNDKVPLMQQLLSQIDREDFNLELLENDHSLFRHGEPGSAARHSLQVGLNLLNNLESGLTKKQRLKLGSMVAAFEATAAERGAEE